MAEILSAQQTVMSVPARRPTAASHGRLRAIVITTPLIYAAALNDTMGSHETLRAGARLRMPQVSNAVGAAASTLNIGLRNPRTKVPIDATALATALPLSAAGNAIVTTGTKLANGIEYVLAEEAEPYFTFTGAAPLANAQIRAEIEYLDA